MPRTVSGEMHIKGTSPFSPKWTEKAEENPPAEITFNQGVTTVEISTPAEVGHGEKKQLRFPDLKLKTKGASNEEINDLQGLLKVRRFDFPLQVHRLMPQWNKFCDTLSSPSPSSRSSKSSTEQENKGTSESGKLADKDSFKDKDNNLPLLPFSTILKGERVKIPSFQSCKNSAEQEKEETSEDNQWSNKDSVKDKNSDLPLLPFSSVLKGERVKIPSYQISKHFTAQDEKETSEGKKWSNKNSVKYKNNALPFLSFSTATKGQRVVTQEKDGSNKQRKQHGKTTKGNRFFQTDSKCQESCNEFEKVKTSKLKIKHQTRSNAVSLKLGKHNQIRSVFQLSKVDKYDITPDGKHTSGSQVYRVFKLNDLKTTLNYSGYKVSWVPRRDQYLMKCSVFKAIMQQPTGFLRQPSPVAGVKMTLQEQDSLAAAIQAVEKTNAPSPPVVAELTQQIKQFVVRLPPIC